MQTNFGPTFSGVMMRGSLETDYLLIGRGRDRSGAPNPPNSTGHLAAGLRLAVSHRRYLHGFGYIAR